MMTEKEVTRGTYKHLGDNWTLTKIQLPEIPFNNEGLSRWIRPSILANIPKATRPGSDFKNGLLTISIFIYQTSNKNFYSKDEIIDALMTLFQNKTINTENGVLRFLQVDPRPIGTKEANLLMYDVEIPFQTIETKTGG